MPDFADLELTLRRETDDAPNEYRVEMRFNLPNSEAETNPLLGKTPQPGAPPNDRVSIDVGALAPLSSAAYGSLLGSFVLGDHGVGRAFATVRKQAQQANAVLRIRLVLHDTAAPLQNVNWEQLLDPDGKPLMASPDIAFSRFVASSDAKPIQSRSRSQLRALVVVINPSNLTEVTKEPPMVPAVRVPEARQALEEGSIQCDVLASPQPGGLTIGSLAKKLDEGEGYDILYLVCHGIVKTKLGGQVMPYLVFEDDAGKANVIEAPDVVTVIESLRVRPRLIVLGSCQSGGKGDGKSDTQTLVDSAFGPRLARAGIPAVVAMRGSVAFDSIAAFMPPFFAALARDGQIDGAMAFARQQALLKDLQLPADQKLNQFWVPVLYMRLKSGRIWYQPGFADKTQETPFRAICKAIVEGGALPILGPAIGESVFGSEQEMASELAKQFNYPLSPFERTDLAKVAQFITVMQTDPNVVRDAVRLALSEQMSKRFPELARKFDNDFDLQQAIVAKLLENPSHPLSVLASFENVKAYITSSTDDLLEMALEAAKRKPVRMVRPWTDERRTEKTKDLRDPELDGIEPAGKQPVLYYAYGTNTTFLSEGVKNDTWVLTEDNFFDYLIRTSSYNLTPLYVKFALTTSTLLFLGFPLEDWRFRVLFRLIRALGGSAKNLPPEENQAIEALKAETGTVQRAESEYAHVAVQLNPDETTQADAIRAKRYLESYWRNSTRIQIYWGTVAEFMKELAEELAKYEAETAGKRKLR